MATVKLIAKKAFLYASISLQVGDEFHASEQDAKTLKHIGHADDAPRLRKTSTKVLTADSGDLSNSSEVKIDRRTREYRRRDLVPEP